MALNPNWKPRFPGDQPPQDNFRMTTTVDPYPQRPTRSGNTGITGIPPGSPAGTQPPWVKNRGVPGKDFIHIRPPGGYGPKTPNNVPEVSANPGSSRNYGAYLNLPPGAVTTMDWVDRDGDGVDDRYQTGPGQPRGGGKGGGKPTKPPRPTRPTAPIKPSPIRPPATASSKPIDSKSKKKRRQAMPVTPLGYLASNNLGESGISAQ